VQYVIYARSMIAFPHRYPWYTFPGNKLHGAIGCLSGCSASPRIVCRRKINFRVQNFPVMGTILSRIFPVRNNSSCFFKSYFNIILGFINIFLGFSLARWKIIHSLWKENVNSYGHNCSQLIHLLRQINPVRIPKTLFFKMCLNVTF
jgi:hypothetical protein